MTDTCVTPSTCVRTGGRGREGEGSRMTNLPPLTLQELRVPTNGVSPVRLERYDHSPYRGREWRDQAEDFNHHNNGIYALQEKINLLKNHPSEIFNFMVVSGSPRLGKNYQYYAIHSTPLVYKVLVAVYCNPHFTRLVNCFNGGGIITAPASYKYSPTLTNKLVPCYAPDK